jgi:hypothetical protein
MTCVHLRKLYQLCQQEELRLGSSDLIRIVCQQCGVQDECPSLLLDEYESKSGPGVELGADRPNRPDSERK